MEKCFVCRKDINSIDYSFKINISIINNEPNNLKTKIKNFSFCKEHKDVGIRLYEEINFVMRGELNK
jgi:hypothetical protein